MFYERLNCTHFNQFAGLGTHCSGFQVMTFDAKELVVVFFLLFNMKTIGKSD